MGNLNKLWDPSGNKTYDHGDVKTMYGALRHYFDDEDQLRAAKDVYKDAINKPGTSPVAAFEQAAMISALAQELDTLHADEGGLMYHVVNVPTSGLRAPVNLSNLSFDSMEDIRNAKALRKVQEIKEIMAAERLENAGGMKWDVKDEIKDEEEVKFKIEDEVKWMVKDDVKDEFKDETKDETKIEDVKFMVKGEVKVKTEDKVKFKDDTVTESDDRVIVKAEDADTPMSG